LNSSVIIPLTKATGFGALPELVEQRASPAALLKMFNAQNLPLEILENRETRLPLCAMMNVFETAARAAGERTFGLDVGNAMSPGDYGMWANYCASAATLGEALDRGVASARFQQSGGILAVAQEGPYTIYRYIPPNCGVSNMQHSDHLIWPMLRFISYFVGPEPRPAWLELAYPRDPLAHLIEDQFDFPIRFGQASVGVAFETALLASPGPDQSEGSLTNQVTLLDVEANEVWPRFDEPVRSIAAILVLRLMEGKSDIEGAAQAAGMGVQTMQRLLRREGTSYRDILDTTRGLRAKALLRETLLSITDIGLSLGYADHANFTRAFKRWAGCPPSTFRNRDPAARARLAHR